MIFTAHMFIEIPEGTVGFPAAGVVARKISLIFSCTTSLPFGLIEFTGYESVRPMHARIVSRFLKMRLLCLYKRWSGSDLKLDTSARPKV